MYITKSDRGARSSFLIVCELACVRVCARVCVSVRASARVNNRYFGIAAQHFSSIGGRTKYSRIKSHPNAPNLLSCAATAAHFSRANVVVV